MDRRVKFSQKLFFGFGHIMNDMCASLWFNYLLVYLHSVLKFTNAMAGTLLLIGQVADALSTPVVGIESDRTSCSRCYPRRKSWHLFGCLMVFCSFAFIFNPCLVCNENTDEWSKFVYFAPIIVIFQIGWASTQISHLAMIPDLTSCEHQRVELTSIRYGFTVASNFVVFSSAWAFITYLPSANHDMKAVPHNNSNPTAMPVTRDQLSEADIPVFRYLALLVIGIGGFFSVGYHAGVKEPMAISSFDSENTETSEDKGPTSVSAAPDDNPQQLGGDGGSETMTQSSDDQSTPLIQSTSINIRMTSTSWLKEPVFYIVGGIYVSVRLVTNVSQVYMSLYINDTLRMNKIHVALVPLTIYAISMVTSLLQKKMNKFIGRKKTLVLGFLIMFAYCTSLYFIKRPPSVPHVYCTALLLGIGTSILMVGSLSLTADMIGNELRTGAFVYGAMSFGDKLFNGLAVEAIQLIHPCERCCVHCVWFYRTIEVFFIGSVTAVGILLLMALALTSVQDLRFYRNLANNHSINRSGRYGSTTDHGNSVTA